MKKYKFNLIERQSLYDAYDRRCFYCGELVYFRELQIDHIVPENLNHNNTKYQAFMMKSGLSDSFQINSYNNWVPSHSRCNNRKSGAMFDLKTTLYFLGLAERKIEKILKIENSIKSKINSDILLTTITLSLSESKFDLSEIKSLISQFENKDKAKFKLFSELEFVDRVYRNWISQNDFDELLELPVKTGSLENEGVFLTDPDIDGKEVNVKNCKEYFHYTNRGYYALTTYSMKMSVFFERTCGLIQALKNATIPSFNYITDSNSSINNFELLPLTLFHSFTPETEDIIGNETELTFHDWIEVGSFKIIEQFDKGFHILHSGEGLIMVELLRADFNNDNIEDILIFCYSYATEGTLGFGYTISITRLNSESKFIEIESKTNKICP